MDIFWFALALFLRWGHILPATILVGAAFYARFAVVPALEELPDDQRVELREKIALNWTTLMSLSAGFLLITGIVNAGVNMTQYSFAIPGLYHGLVLLKFILGCIVLYIASMLSGRSESAKEFRNSTKFYLTINCWLAVALVLLGGAMKLIDRTKKTPPAQTPSPAVAPEETAPATP